MGARPLSAFRLRLLVGVLVIVLFLISSSSISLRESQKPATALQPPSPHAAGPPPRLQVDDLYHDTRYMHNLKGIMKRVLTSSDHTLNETAWQTCLAHTHPDHMYIDTSCMAMWMWKVRHGGVVGIDKVRGVSKTEDMRAAGQYRDVQGGPVYMNDKLYSNGGFRAKLDDLEGTRGYWKPCREHTGNEESYFAEIISFLIDRALGFCHTPAVMPRAFRVDWLRQLGQMRDRQPNYQHRGEAERRIESIIANCHVETDHNTYVEGAIIGWTDLELIPKKEQMRTILPFTKMKKEKQIARWEDKVFRDLTSSTPVEERQPKVENLALQLFSVLSGNLEHFGDEIFRHPLSEPGEPPRYVYLDNDHAQWMHPVRRAKKLRMTNPWTRFCKFPKHIAHRILFWREGNPRGATLGSLLLQLTRQVLDPYVRDEGLWGEDQAAVLDNNLEFVAEMIDFCVARDGPASVFVDETWPQPSVYDDIDSLFGRLFVPP